MNNIALARLWRPRTFAQLVGQEHVTKALSRALSLQRLHHAYLFTGTRGVGKTSVARLLAKSLNCEQGISAEPCLQCESCLAIEQGRFLDLIEIDGASRTRVEDTREILENIHYAPTHGRFKIYLIDEVHMLSQHSFNALLKTLEEPPEHVKFLLATTEPQKLPLTVLSRCLQFTLKHIALPVITQQLQQILNHEKITFDIAALHKISQAASGSMRDALTLLETALMGCDGALQLQHVNDILGHTQKDYALQILQALSSNNVTDLITISRDIALTGGHFNYVLEEILHDLHQITLAQQLPLDTPLLTAEPEIVALSTKISPEDAQLFYEIVLKAMQDIQFAPSIAIGFEMTLLRMYTFLPAAFGDNPVLMHTVTDNKNTPSIATDLPAITNTAPQDLNWGQLLLQLQLKGLAQTAAMHAELVEKTTNTIVIRVATGHKSVFTPAVINRIEESLTKHFKNAIKLIIQHDTQVASPAAQQKQQQVMQHQEAEAALLNDQFFQQLQQEFSAEIVKNSIVPRKDGL